MTNTNNAACDILYTAHKAIGPTGEISPKLNNKHRVGPTEYNPMTMEQKAVLRHMADNNIGATPIEGIWYFPQNIREDAGIADILYNRFFPEVASCK